VTLNTNNFTKYSDLMYLKSLYTKVVYLYLFVKFVAQFISTRCNCSSSVLFGLLRVLVVCTLS